MSGNPGYLHASALQMDKEQHIICHQTSPTEYFNRKEIATGQHIHVSREEILPGRNLTSFGSRSDAVPPEDVLHGLSTGARLARAPTMRS
jgi:hypothetical protein